MVQKFKFWAWLKASLGQNKVDVADGAGQENCRWGQPKQGCCHAEGDEECPYASGMYFQGSAGSGMTVLRLEQQAQHKAKAMEPLDPVHSCPKERGSFAESDTKGLYCTGSPGSGATVSQKSQGNSILLDNKSEAFPFVSDNWTIFNASDVKRAK